MLSMLHDTSFGLVGDYFATEQGMPELSKLFY